MCDAIMEAISVALCRAYIDAAGRVAPLSAPRTGAAYKDIDDVAEALEDTGNSPEV